MKNIRLLISLYCCCCWVSLLLAQNPALYPGDANNNGIANHIDLLYIGSAFGAEGAARTNYDVNFTAIINGGTPPYTYAWSWGSNEANPSLIYDVNGNYSGCVTITDAIGNSCIECVNFSIGDSINNSCTYEIQAVTDSFSLQTSFSIDTGNIGDYTWDFGNGDTSSNSNPTITYATEGIYQVCVTTTDIEGNICTICNDFAISNTPSPLTCNIVLEVNPLVVTTSVWTEQTIPQLWIDNFANGNNYAFADCDGNGLIEGLDVDVLDTNYDQTHSPITPDVFTNGMVNIDPVLGLENIDSIQNPAGTIVEIPIILGTFDLPIESFYATAFNIQYDTAFIKEGSISIQFYLNSWIHTDNSGLISIQKDKYQEGLIEAALSRTNQVGIDGFGEIGKISFIIEDDLVGALQQDSSIDIEIQQTKVVDPFLNEQVIANGSVSIPINTLNSIANPRFDKIKIYPNPANHAASIYFDDTDVQQLDLINSTGVCVPIAVHPQKGVLELDLSAIPTGVYFVKIRTLKNNLTKKIIIKK